MTFVPTYVTPLKDNSHIADGEHRYKMCMLATQDYPQLEVSDVELRRKGESYTSDTVAALKEEDDTLFLLVGAWGFLLSGIFAFRYLEGEEEEGSNGKGDCGRNQVHENNRLLVIRGSNTNRKNASKPEFGARLHA